MNLPYDYSPWSEAEMDVLRAGYERGGFRGVSPKLPGRSEKSVRCKARKIGLVNEHRRPWKEDEIARLKGNWGMEDVDTIAKFLGRTKLGVVFMAAQLGLKRGAPEGWEFLSASVARSGYGMESLRMILKWAKVRVIGSYSFSETRRGRKRQWRRHIVEPGDVDFAIQQWVLTESLHSAAVARGVGDVTLMRMMKACGGEVFRLKKRVGPAYIRAESEEWDRAVREHADRAARKERMDEAAARHGVSTNTMRAWLRSAGHKRESRYALIDKTVVDAAAAQCRRKRAA